MQVIALARSALASTRPEIARGGEDCAGCGFSPAAAVSFFIHRFSQARRPLALPLDGIALAGVAAFEIEHRIDTSAPRGTFGLGISGEHVPPED